MNYRTGNPLPTPNSAKVPLRRGNTTGATRALAGVRGQTRTPEQDMADLKMEKLRCAAHLIEYYLGQGDRKVCPMCELEHKMDDLKVMAIEANGQIKALQEENDRLRVQVEIGSAIKSAIAVLGEDDYAWLKIQMYQYKIDKSVQLKATHTGAVSPEAARRGEKMPANGFMAIPRVGNPEAHMATSIGGIAMAGYLDEAMTCYGPAQGMGIMLKAWWQALPGGQS